MATALPAAMASSAPARVSPAEFANFLPAPVTFSTAGYGWQDLTLQRIRYAPTCVNLPAARDHRLALHLAGPTLIEDKQEGRERRWSDSGHASFIPAGVPKVRDIKGRPDFLLIHIAHAVVDEVIVEVLDLEPTSVTFLDRLAVPDKTLDQLGRLLLAEADGGALGGRLIAEMLMRTLVVHLLRRYSSLASPMPAPPRAMLNGRLLRVLDHMQANLADPLPLVHLAAVAGTNPSQFARAFREATGEPPHRYLTRLRIEQAQNLLEHTALPIIKVGLECGFDQPSHFATTFRQKTGMSPRTYRQARRM